MKELKQETATRKRPVIVLLPNSYGFLFDKANQRINWTNGLYSKEGF